MTIYTKRKKLLKKIAPNEYVKPMNNEEVLLLLSEVYRERLTPKQIIKYKIFWDYEKDNIVTEINKRRRLKLSKIIMKRITHYNDAKVKNLLQNKYNKYLSSLDKELIII